MDIKDRSWRAKTPLYSFKLPIATVILPELRTKQSFRKDYSTTHITIFIYTAYQKGGKRDLNNKKNQELDLFWQK